MNKKSANGQLRRQSQFQLRPVYAAVLLAFAAQTAQANPTGASVVSGSAGFATSGNTLTVTNTPGTIINWQGFSIGSNEVTRFAQQSASSTVLNRVTGNDPSNILGTLQSNGRVFLVNPNGILFGAGAIVDVAGLVASTLSLSDADFKAGNYHFTQVPGASDISNAGSITAQDHGQIYLIAPNVENTGVITAPNGEILLAAGYSVDLVSTDDPNLRVNITAPAGNATNIGQLIASSGSLGLFGTVVSNSGIVNADSATMQGGKIVFKASQRTEISGTVSANGTTGGSVAVLGNQVGIMDGATISADGAQGGGTVLIGGDAHGANPDVQNAQLTYVAPTATISADATQSGDGGKVVVWSDKATQFGGHISARGGAASGNGGWVEVSGKQWLGYAGLVNTTAAHGMVGSLLLDPTDITISNALDTITMAATPTLGGTSLTTFADPTALTTSNLNVGTLQTQLGLSNVTVDTTSALGLGVGNITVQDSILWNSANTLTLNAVGTGTITVSALDTAGAPLTISNTGAGNLSLFTVAGSINLDGGISLAGGAFTTNAGGATSDVNIASAINTGAGAINLTAGQSITELTGGNLTTTGLLTTKSAIGTTLDGTNSVGSFMATNTGSGAISLTNTAANWTLLGIDQTSAGAVTLTNSGIITPTGAVTTGSFTLTGGTWDQVSATLPGFTASTGFNITGGTFIRALSGDGVNTPYQLADIYGVEGMSSGLGLSYVLANDIDASVTQNWRNANGAIEGFIPIGYNTDHVFAGQFDGQSHTISNLVIDGNNGLSVSDVGLFGYVSGGTISDIGLVNASVTGTSYVGGLVGYNQNGIISNSYVRNSHVIGGTVSGTGNYVGGLVGYNSLGTISNSYVSGGTVTAAGNYAGGLVGYNLGTINNASNATGVNVSGVSNVGGLVGFNGAGSSSSGSYSGSTIIGSYVSGGTVTATGNNAGGLVGSNEGNVIDDKVYTPTVSGTNSVGGLVGLNGNTTTGASGNSNISGSFVSGGTVSGNSNVGGLAGTNSSGSNISNTHVSGGNVISSATDTSANAGGLVGNNSGAISNSYVSNGNVSSSAGTSSNWSHNFGGLVGQNTGSISTSYVSGGSVSSVGNGSFNIGGLVGENNGGGSTIDTSFASNVTVKGNNTDVGGLVGNNSGSISNTYASGGTVSASDDVGGLVGYNTGSIATSYASVAVSSIGSYGGGLVGVNYGSPSSISASFWNTTVAGVSSGIGYDPASYGGAVGMSDADMKTMANFTSATAANGNSPPGWDFTSGTVWHMTDGLSMPLLPFSPLPVAVAPDVIDEIVNTVNQNDKPKPEELVIAEETPGTVAQSLPVCN